LYGNGVCQCIVTIRRTVAAVLVLCVLLAGCSGPSSPATPTAIATEASTSAADETASPSEATTAAPPTSGSQSDSSTANETERTLTVTLSEGTTQPIPADRDLTLSVSANTSLPTADVGSAGDPFFSVALDGEQVTETEEVARDADGQFSVTVPAAAIEPHAGGEVTLNVTLWDGDVFSDDRITSTMMTVAVAQATSGATSTAPSTATPAPTSTTAAPEPTATATPTPEPTATPTPKPTETATLSDGVRVDVVRIVDGDTFEVRFPGGDTEDVRLLGIDTPEVHTENDPAEFEGIPTTSAGESHLRDWGHKASEFARTRLAGETVTVRTDPTADRRGSYGRLLVYVLHDGENVNQQLIEQGYARLYDSEFSERSAFERAERTARSNGVGLWNYDAPETATPEPVPDGGAADSLSVVAINADAPGNDHDNLNEETITFENTGDSALDLSGWTVRDEADHSYTFPSLTLAPGETVTLHTGSGTDGGGDLYWGSGSAVWNNGGDTIIVTDDSGSVVIERSYS
jgi:micrococcal nuclease